MSFCEGCGTILHPNKRGDIRTRCRACPINPGCTCKCCNENEYNDDPSCCGWAHYPCQPCMGGNQCGTDHQCQWGSMSSNPYPRYPTIPFWGVYRARSKRAHLRRIRAETGWARVRRLAPLLGRVVLAYRRVAAASSAVDAASSASHATTSVKLLQKSCQSRGTACAAVW